MRKSFMSAIGKILVIATYGSAYSLASAATIEIKYEAGGYTTVTAIRSGTTTTLFNRISDTTFTSGNIGVGGWLTAAYFDNVVVTVP